MATSAPAIHLIPFNSGFRIEWTNPCAYTSIVLVSDILTEVIIRGPFAVTSFLRRFQDTADISTTAKLAERDFNSIPTVRDESGVPTYLGDELGARIAGSGTIHSISISLRVTVADGTQYTAGPIFTFTAPGVADPGPTLVALQTPSPLSEAHKIDRTQLEEACMKFIPARLQCDWEGGFGHLARFIGAADYLKLQSMQKVAEEIYSSTTELAISELEDEYYDLSAGCYIPSNTLDIRRRAVLARKRSRGGNTRQFFNELLSTLSFREVEIIETHQTRFGAFRFGDNLQQSSVWIKWGRIIEAVNETQRTDILSALECIISETRQSGTAFYIAQDSAATTFKQVP